LLTRVEHHRLLEIQVRKALQISYVNDFNFDEHIDFIEVQVLCLSVEGGITCFSKDYKKMVSANKGVMIV
jgi:hypothetical protein